MSEQLGMCDKRQYEHNGPHRVIPENGQNMPPFPCVNWHPVVVAAPTERVEMSLVTNYAGIVCNSFISGGPFPQFCKKCGLVESAHRVSPEKLAIIIRDWFLNSGCHYAGWGEFEADIDGTFKFDELAKAILSQAAVAPSPAGESQEGDK